MKEALVAMRRHLHAHPELSMREFETSAYVLEKLRALPFDEIRTGVAETGVLATLRGAHPGPVTLLRADMDALPIEELGAAPYRSTTPGVMHACGHDGHVSILLGAAQTLCGRRDEVHGTIVFCFQPGEEGSAGNRLMIEAGALEDPHVDRVFALHLYSGLAAGKIGIRDGPFLPSSDRFTIEILGSGGHGAMPHTARDPIVAAGHVITVLQTIVSREIAPEAPVVVSIGAVHAGTTFNVIPDTATLRGTVRCFASEVRRTMPERIERIVDGICDALRVEHRFTYAYSYPMTVNDPAMADLVRAAGTRAIGAKNVLEHEVIMMAEDMAFMHEQRPGGYALVGTRSSDATAFPNHSPRFEIDEHALVVGHDLMVELALGEAAVRA
ncbi:MAG: M20 family metallopeptidase [Candidatus Velthaea sp.]